jgi:hypothetical protein
MIHERQLVRLPCGLLSEKKRDAKRPADGWRALPARLGKRVPTRHGVHEDHAAHSDSGMSAFFFDLYERLRHPLRSL